MATDRARRAHDPTRRYRSVVAQQAEEIERRSLRALTRDLIGLCGGPQGEAGFEISVDPSGESLVIGAGRYYVDGLMVENDVERALDPPPDLPVGQYICYLDVWHRERTWVEDEGLRDPALGGPDTSSRLQVAWQVRLDPAEVADCADPKPASLAVRIRGGYNGLENVLYRIEIHSVDKAGKVSFKWSRDNATMVTPPEPIDAQREQWIGIEDAIEIAIDGGPPLAGDYWLFTVRPATEDVDWHYMPQPPSGVKYVCCPLALIEIGEERGRWRVLEDRRRLFAPLATNDRKLP